MSIPGPVLWVQHLLDSNYTRHQLAKARFKQFDANGNGVLEWTQLCNLTLALCEQMGIAQPANDKLRVVYDEFDKNQDGVLSEDEFQAFFKTVLKASLPSSFKAPSYQRAPPPGRTPREIRVRDLAGKLLCSDRELPDQTVSAVKDFIAPLAQIPKYKQQLVVGGEILKDKMAISDLPGATLEITLIRRDPLQLLKQNAHEGGLCQCGRVKDPGYPVCEACLKVFDERGMSWTPPTNKAAAEIYERNIHLQEQMPKTRVDAQ